MVLVYFNELCGELLMMVVVVVVVLLWVFFLLWVVVVTMVVVGANGGCFGFFFAVGYGCYNGAGGGERGWQKFQFVGF